VVDGPRFLARSNLRQVDANYIPTPMSGDTFTLVLGLVGELAGIDLISSPPPGATLLTADLGFDSMLLFELFTRIEDDWRLQITGWSTEDLSLQNLSELVETARQTDQQPSWTSSH
jgi:acyl carrier protein